MKHLLHQHPGSPFPLFYTIVAEKYLHPYTQRFRARETAVSDLRDNTSLSLSSPLPRKNLTTVTLTTVTLTSSRAYPNNMLTPLWGLAQLVVRCRDP